MNLRLLAGVSVFWFGLSMLFDGLTALVLPYLLLAGAMSSAEAAASATPLGLATFAGIGLGMVVQPIVGRASDAGGSRRAPMLVGCAGSIVGLAVMSLADGFLPLLAGYLLAMLGGNVAQAGQQALAPDRVHGPWRGRAAGTKGLLDLAGSSSAFVLIGALLADGDAADALLAVGVGLVATLVIALVLTPPAPVETERVPPEPADGLARVVLARFLFLLAVYAVGRYLVLFLADRLDLSAAAAAAEAGLVLGVLALLTALASLPSGWAADRFGRRMPAVGGAVVAAGGIGILAVAPTTPLILVGGGLMAIGTALFGAASWALLTDIAAPGDAGRRMGLANLGTAGAAAAAGLLGPAVDLGEGVGPGIGFVLLFVLATMAALAGGMLVADRPRRLAVAKEC